jgi:hypothetical protein
MPLNTQVGVIRWRWWLAALCSVLLLLACDRQNISELEEGLSTEADVRERFGPPEAVWDGEDGAQIYEYNRQPAGYQNYMITIGADGKMTALRQVLTPENFASIQPGMPMEAVRRLLGKPMKVTTYELKRSARGVDNVGTRSGARHQPLIRAPGSDQAARRRRQSSSAGRITSRASSAARGTVLM